MGGNEPGTDVPAAISSAAPELAVKRTGTVVLHSRAATKHDGGPASIPPVEHASSLLSEREKAYVVVCALSAAPAVLLPGSIRCLQMKIFLGVYLIKSRLEALDPILPLIYTMRWYR